MHDRPHQAKSGARCRDPLQAEHGPLRVGIATTGRGPGHDLYDDFLVLVELGGSAEHGAERIERVVGGDRQPLRPSQAEPVAGRRSMPSTRWSWPGRDDARTGPRSRDHPTHVFGRRARRRDGEADTLADCPYLEGDLVAAVEDSPPGRAQQGVEVRPEDLRAPWIDDRGWAELQAHGVHRQRVMREAGDVVDPNKSSEDADPYVLARAVQLRAQGLEVVVVTDDDVDRMPIKISLTTACGRVGVRHVGSRAS